MTTQKRIFGSFCTALLAVAALTLNAQVRYGFKTGLNFARLDGPSELNDAGAELETWKNTTGFHIGMTFSYHFTDNVGLRGEFLYSKRGAKYTYDGQSYRVFRYDGGSTLAAGNSKYLLNLNNSYLDLPVMAFARLGDFEISGGGYVGFLVQSASDGSLTFSDGRTVPLGNEIEKIQFNLQHNYRKDKPGEGVKNSATFVARVDARNIELPKTVGAYFDHPEDRGSLYNTIDYGLTGGVTYYFSRALYINARLQYGLADVTNNDADLSKARTDENGGLLFRDDKDRNFVIQTSVGFSF
jgi:hypothetical protein